MKLTFECISPNISDEDRKTNIESFYNTLLRVEKIKNFSHCKYDLTTKNLHIVINKEDH
jgi:hypothetical protein